MRQAHFLEVALPERGFRVLEGGGHIVAIIRENSLETNSRFPNTDWYNEGNEVIDETTPEGKALVEKLLVLSPFYKLIRDSEGNIIDAEDDLEARQAWELEEQQRREDWERTRPPTEQERIEALEFALLDLLFQGGDM